MKFSKLIVGLFILVILGALYIYKGRNLLRPTAPKPKPNPATFFQPYPAGMVIGFLDGALKEGIYGWACAIETAEVLPVRVFIGGPKESGEEVTGNYVADQASEPEVFKMCRISGGSGHRFKINLPGDILARSTGKPVFVYGKYKNSEVALKNSGAMFLKN